MSKRFGLLIAVPVVVGLVLILLVVLAVNRSGTSGAANPLATTPSSSVMSTSPPPESLPQVTPAFLEPDSNKVGFGAFNNGRELQIPGVIHHEFIDFAPGSVQRLAAAVTTAASQNAVALISWEPQIYGQPDRSAGMLAEIADGALDVYLREAADALRNTRQTVLLRFAQEMDLPTSQLHPWAGQDAALFIQAWRHAHRIFDREGADNVLWVWTPAGRLGHDGRLVSKQWYPGGRWTDMVGFTVYCYWRWEEWNAQRRATHMVRSPAELVLPRYRAIAPLGKPIIIPEFGIELAPTRQDEEVPWLKLFVDLVQTQMPHLAAVVYFHAAYDVPGKKPGDWRLRPAQQRAFGAMLAHADRFELHGS